MKSCLCVALTLLFGCEVAETQELVETSRATVSGTAGLTHFAIGMAPSCAADGAILLAPVQPPRAQVDVVWRVSPDGRNVTKIDVTSFPAFAKAGLVDARLMPDGDAVLLVGVSTKGSGTTRALLTVDSRGRLLAKTPLDDAHWTTVVPLSSGRFLASGARIDDTADLSVLSASGQRESTVRPRVSEDERPGKAQDDRAIDDRVWADLTMAEPTPDDHAWVVRPDIRGPAYEVDSSGEILKTFELLPPPGAAELVMMKISRRRMAVLYALDAGETGPRPQVISVFDADSGSRIADYRPAGLGIFCCYVNDDMGDTFRFLAPTPDGLVLRNTVPR